jgi:HD-like signal output (HDOD) protein
MTPPSEAELSALLGKLNIPPCPAVLKDISSELRKENCNQQRVAKLIRSDVALASAVLRIVNSAASGTSRKISSINEAIAMLGNQQLVNFVVGDFLKRMLSVPKSQGLERFWDRAAYNAKVCALLAARLQGTSPDTAYCFGLFHDCGIPLMMQRYPDYVDTLRQANQSEGSFTAIEETRYGTDHAIIGYLLTRSWGLADVLCEAIRSHHDYLVLDQSSDHGVSDEACTLIALSLISECIVGKFLRTQEVQEWQQDVVLAAAFFALSLTELEDLVDDILFQLQQQDAQRYA